jgi:hypothetical protein
MYIGKVHIIPKRKDCACLAKTSAEKANFSRLQPKRKPFPQFRQTGKHLQNQPLQMSAKYVGQLP